MGTKQRHPKTLLIRISELHKTWSKIQTKASKETSLH